MSKKSQLPMLRSLKTIARRKMNQEYKVPDELRKQFTADAERAKREHDKQVRKVINRMPAAMLRLEMLCRLRFFLQADEQALLANFRLNYPLPEEAVTAWDLQHAWVENQKAMARATFEELERIELQIIAGEEVDLAPYARQLSS